MADGGEVGSKSILLEIRVDEPGRETNARVSVHRWNTCFNLHDGATSSTFLPWALRNYILNKYSALSPPFNLTAEDVTTELDTYRVTPCNIAKHRLTRGLGGTIEPQYLTRWENLTRPSWEHEEDLHQCGNHVVSYWAGNLFKTGAEAQNTVGTESEWQKEALHAKNARYTY